MIATRNRMLSGLVMAAVIILASMAAGCDDKDDDKGGKLNLDGSTTVLPIAQKTADAYMDLYPKVEITVSGTGSSNGVKAAGDGTADIGMASRDLKASEKEQYPGLIEHVIAKDGIAVIVHKENPVNYLTLEQIRGIYNGTYTNWNEIGGEDEEIVVIGRDSASGTREFFWKNVMHKDEFVDGMLEKSSNGAVHDSVKDTEGAIGFVGLGYVDDEIKPLKVYHNDMKLLPTVENVKRGTYPIARNLHLITDGEPEGLVEDFIDFMLSEDGQQIVEEEGFVPLTSTHTKGSLSLDGSTTVLPIAQAIADVYMDYYNGVDISVSGTGSSNGIKAAGDGTADIGMASREMKDSEKSNYPDLIQHVIAKDGIAMIIYKSNPVNNLTLDQIRGIYNGTYTNWDEVGGEDEEIVVVGRDSASGTREFFWKNVMHKDEFVDGMLEKSSNGAVHDTVKDNGGAIGFVGLGYVDNEIKAVKVKEDAGSEAVYPTVESVKNGKYPIARNLYMLTDGEPTGLKKEFLDFVLSGEGQKIVKDENFVPLD